MRHTPEAGAVCGNSASRSLNLLIQSGNGGSMGMFTGFPSLDHAEKIFCNFYSEPPPDTPPSTMASRSTKDGRMPVERLGLAQAPLDYEDIIYFPSTD